MKKIGSPAITGFPVWDKTNIAENNQKGPKGHVSSGAADDAAPVLLYRYYLSLSQT